VNERTTALLGSTIDLESFATARANTASMKRAVVGERPAHRRRAPARTGPFDDTLPIDGNQRVAGLVDPEQRLRLVGHGAALAGADSRWPSATQ
jgi:hypothetical protein